MSCRDFFTLIVTAAMTVPLSSLDSRLVTMSTILYRGSCLCGGISFTMASPPIEVGNCFCPDCQKNAGGPFQTNAIFAANDMAVHDPEKLETFFVVTKTASGQPKEKHFCKRCGCNLWSYSTMMGFPTRGVRVSLIDDGLNTFKPSAERFVGRRPTYIPPAPGAEQLQGD